MIGFVVGNGKSRLKWDLSIFKESGRIYGCNALYRDFESDVLVSVDGKMVNEVMKSNYKGEFLYVGLGTNSFFSNKTHPVNLHGMKRSLCESRGWASGPSAIWLLCKYNKVEKVNLIGFDLHGIDKKINNIYAGTDNYQPIHANPTPYGSWVKQMKIVFAENKDVKFYYVNEVLPGELHGIQNLIHVQEPVLE